MFAAMAGVGGTAGRGNVHLKPDAVDRYALQQQLLQQHVDAIRFGRSALAAIVVVEKQRPGIRLAREAESVGDVPVAQFLPEHGVPQRTPAVGDGFVDDVPRMNPAAVVPDDGADVLFERRYADRRR